MYGGFGRLTGTLVRIPNYSITLSPKDLDTAIEFQAIIFRDVLDLNHPLLLPTRSNRHPYVIVPLVRVRGKYNGGG